MSDLTTRAAAHLPLTDMAYHVLVGLGEEALHGYAIGQTIADLSGGRLTPTTGSLYQVLRRFVEAGLVEPVDAPAGMGDDARRRFFRITALGREVRRLETARLGRLVSAARRSEAAGG